MSAIKWMPYTLIAGVVLISLLAGFLIGWDDAWPVPVIVIPLALLYAAYDRTKARREETSEPRTAAGRNQSG